jgi:molecular chaperone DnaK (HSP70)
VKIDAPQKEPLTLSTHPQTGEMQLGIDLGTTFSVVAACQRGNVTVMEVDGRRTMPSIVSALDGGHLVVGHEAAKRRLTHPEDTVYNVKRIIGRRLADVGIKAELEMFPYSVKEDVIPDSRSLTGKKIKGGPALRVYMPNAASPMTPQVTSTCASFPRLPLALT